MSTSTHTWVAVYADPVLGEQSQRFFVERNDYNQIVQIGLHADF